MTENPIEVVAIVVAAGRGQRLPGDVPKQFRLLGGKPVLWHTLCRLDEVERISRIIVVGREEDMGRHEELLRNGGPSKVDDRVIRGGVERVDSVLAGLRETDDSADIVLVHDGVRPRCTRALVDRVIDAAVSSGAAIAAVRATDTVKIATAEGTVSATPDRDAVWQAQTPQAFTRELLMRAFATGAVATGATPATDEASLVERLGHPVHLVEGERDNIKITTERDLRQLQWQLDADEAGAASGSEQRVGQGYDVHRLVAGRKLVLAGLEIPHEGGLGLLGHSDADVLTHAVIDALLGAAGMGDIGRLFPDDDPAYEDISSLLLLDRVQGLLAAAGARVVNVDAVVMAQAPKLQPHIATMESTLAQHLGVATGRVSVKATTTEQLGFVGREEGIAAQAVAAIVYGGAPVGG